MVRSEAPTLKNISFLYQAYKPKFWYAEVRPFLRLTCTFNLRGGTRFKRTLWFCLKIVNCVYKLLMTAGIALLDYSLLSFEIDDIIRKGCIQNNKFTHSGLISIICLQLTNSYTWCLLLGNPTSPGIVYVVAVMVTIVFLVVIYETNVFIDVHDHWFCKCETIIFFFMVAERFHVVLM